MDVLVNMTESMTLLQFIYEILYRNQLSDKEYGNIYVYRRGLKHKNYESRLEYREDHLRSSMPAYYLLNATVIKAHAETYEQDSENNLTNYFVTVNA